MFYYFRLEDQVPENHLLRLIEKHNGSAAAQNIKRLVHFLSQPVTPTVDAAF